MSVSSATPCTICTCPRSSGLILSLDQNNASVWQNDCTGFTKYQYTWHAPATTSATIQFQFYTNRSGNYWDLATVSVRDSSGAEKIINGNFYDKSSWNETCGMNSCASIQPYGPGGSLDYWVTCHNATNHYSVSQRFPIVANAIYNVSFQISRFQGPSGLAKAYVYVS